MRDKILRWQTQSESTTGVPAIPVPSAQHVSKPSSLQPPAATTVPPAATAVVQNHGTGAATKRAGTLLPEHGRLIPNLKGRGKYQHPNESWKQAIQDWFHPDPAAGLLVALKDWDPAWVRGTNGKIDSRGPKYHQRKLVAEEYMMCVSGFKFSLPRH